MASGLRLTAILRAADPGGSVPDGPETEAQLERLVAAGRTAWPALDLGDEAFVRHLAGQRDDASNVGAWLAGLHAGDAWLAWSCALAVPGAIEAFDRWFAPRVRGWLARQGPGDALVDDVRQIVRERLLVAAPGGRAKIGDYAGRGPLAAWLRVVAVREAGHLQRKSPELLDDQRRERAPQTPDGDAEIEFIKQRYHDDFEAAFKAALGALDVEKRNLLRFHFVDGLTLEQVATLLRVHRATAARWIAEARDAIYESARTRLESRLQLRPGEFDSLAGLVRSQLDLSIVSALRRPG